MSVKRVKVNDRRMFTQDGELREEFRHLKDAAPVEDGAARPSGGGGGGAIVGGTAAPGAAAPPGRGTPAPAAPRAPAPGPRVEGYPDASGAQAPGLLDLVGLLAEPASVYLREAQSAGLDTVAGANSAEQSLELARLHIDLLGTLRDKTAGNLDPQEQAMLDDVLYRLRTGYVQLETRTRSTR